MNTLKILLPLIVVLITSGCATVGPTLRIDTPEPMEDFVVLCQKTTDYLIEHTASGRIKVDDVLIVSSGEEVDCGIMFGGSQGHFSFMHPLIRGGEFEEVDGITIVHPKTNLQYLDELEEKFESGYWDKYKWPDSRFINSVRGVCLGTFNYYFGYYLSNVDNFDFEEFKNRYYQPVLECRRKEQEYYSDSRIRDGMREKYFDPEAVLIDWWKKMEKIANEYK